jgi:hypothetical protein
MAKRPVKSVADDFTGVVEFLTARGIIPQNPPQHQLYLAKRIHRATYALILWRFRLRKLREHGAVFIEEIASDALQLLPQALMGYGKTTKLLTRGIIENTLRHIYFSDHPIEFERMNRDTKWYLQMEDLFGYAVIHPAFIDIEPRFAAVNKLKTLYGDLSAGIHGRRVQDLEMRIALKKIVYTDEAAQREAEMIERCAESANFALAIFHHQQVRGFQLEDRRIILRTMPKNARRIWNEVE